MVNYLDEDEFKRWIAHAKSTLKSAENDKNTGFYNWACFKAQQASEYAAKAYLRGIGTNSFGHSVSALLKRGEFSEKLIDYAKKIDKYYIPTRYTDVWAEGSPNDYYTIGDADDSIECSRSIIDGVEDKWKSLKSG